MAKIINQTVVQLDADDVKTAIIEYARKVTKRPTAPWSELILDTGKDKSGAWATATVTIGD